MSGPGDVAAPPDGARRLTRGLGAAIASTLVALVSHVTAGGALPGPLGVVVPLVFSFTVCSVLAGVRMRWMRLSVSVAVSQLMFHVLFVLGATTPGTTSSSAVGHAGHHGADAAGLLAGTAEPVAHLAHASAGMWVAHALAGVVTVLALRHGEVVAARIAAVLLRFARRLLVLLPRPTSVVARPAAAAIVVADGPVRRVLLLALGGVTRRGPPLAGRPALT
ncbi:MULTISPECIES: hypothetical protein [Cellulomonas]|uniref:Integral membrane protein n=1 Tax=Cellulomonas iranensis TaxID=76862 RepID=A0ABU0GKK4_9CELL|nr:MULTISPECIES: hypothetical protein [Cellulomonas]MDQ0425618.1 hypothetical protein [Cellulomonas iranensis]TFH72096.1 hypothetical protein E4A51_08255 [Cellulomonas sp. HD19AZ1]